MPGHISYGPSQIRAQIKGAYDAGYEEWILWNAAVKYRREAFLTEEEAEAERMQWETEKQERESGQKQNTANEITGEAISAEVQAVPQDVVTEKDKGEETEQGQTGPEQEEAGSEQGETGPEQGEAGPETGRAGSEQGQTGPEPGAAAPEAADTDLPGTAETEEPTEQKPPE